MALPFFSFFGQLPSVKPPSAGDLAEKAADPSLPGGRERERTMPAVSMSRPMARCA